MSTVTTRKRPNCRLISARVGALSETVAGPKVSWKRNFRLENRADDLAYPDQMSGTGTEPMSHPVQSTPAAAGRGRFRITALVVVAAAVGVILWLALRNHGGSLTASTAATAISPAQITGLARKVDHPVFWLGPRPGNTYELTTLSNGTIYIRYLPAGVAVGTVKPYSTVVTYPFGGAYAALQSVAKQRGTTPASIANGGLAVASASYPES